MPYRVDLSRPPRHAADVLIELGALDVEPGPAGLAALMPDAVPPADVAAALGGARLRVTPAVGRDDGSVWTLSPRVVQVGALSIRPATLPAAAASVRLVDSPAFGTGLHPTTALCLEWLETLICEAPPACLLDVGTGSGILALAALCFGVPRATGLEIDEPSLGVAAENARLNQMSERLALLRGGPEVVEGVWPLVAANIRSAELIELAPLLARRTASRGRIILSGIPSAVAAEVEAAYVRVGMVPAGASERGGWTALVVQPSW